MAFASLLALLLLTVLTASWWFDARRVTALALDRVGAATGLDWRITGEPELQWQPRPWLALPGLSVRDAQDRLLLGAERAEIALPWSTLRGESLRIEALHLNQPDIDLEAALDWWNAQPAHEEATLPELDGLLVSGGRIRWATTSVDQLQLALPRFAIGEAMALSASGRVSLPLPEDSAPADAAPVEPFDVDIKLDATPQSGPLRLEGLQLGVSGTGPIPPTQARGRLQFAPWQLALDGEIASWPAAWPALPAPLSSSTAPISFSATQDGESALAAQATLELRRDDSRVSLRGAPEALMDWLRDEQAAALPPVAASARLPTLELDGIRMEGVSIAIEAIEASEPGMPPVEPKP